jgi:hypothetical protein
MTDATVSTTSAAPTVVVDIEATIKAEVAKAVAAVKAEESKIVTFVKTYWPHVTAALAGYGVAAFGVIEKIAKLI